MRVEIGLRLGIGAGIFDLLVDRIGIDHDPPLAGEVMLAQPRRAAEIDQRVGFAEELVDARARQSQIAVIDRVPIGPARPQAETLHHALQVFDVGCVVDDDAVEPRVVGVGAVILDVPRLEAQPLETEQVMQGLPGDTRQGHLAGEMQHNHTPARGHGFDRSGAQRREARQ